MHEYYLADRIARTLIRLADEHRLSKVKRVYLRYSFLTGIDPHTLGQALELSLRGTSCEGAELLAREIHPPGYEDEFDPASDLRAHDHPTEELDRFLSQDIVIEKVDGETAD